MGDCHYVSGNHRAAKRFSIFRNLLSHVGIPSERLLIEWVSASEGGRFAEVVDEFTSWIRSLGPLETKASASRSRPAQAQYSLSTGEANEEAA